MKTNLLWLWQAPQNILGFLVKVFTKARKVGNHYEYGIDCGSVSLGRYIFLCPSHCDDKTVVDSGICDCGNHEFTSLL